MSGSRYAAILGARVMGLSTSPAGAIGDAIRYRRDAESMSRRLRVLPITIDAAQSAASGAALGHAIEIRDGEIAVAWIAGGAR